MMNLIHYNNFADHIKNTYKSDCTIYLENNGQMELMVGAEISDQLMEQYLKYVGPKYIVSESQLPLMGTENIFPVLFSVRRLGQKSFWSCFPQNTGKHMKEIPLQILLGIFGNLGKGWPDEYKSGCCCRK